MPSQFASAFRNRCSALAGFGASLFFAGDIPASADQSVAPRSEPYTWKNVAIVAGGFMPGIEFHPTKPGLAYIRADMGGAYR